MGGIWVWGYKGICTGFADKTAEVEFSDYMRGARVITGCNLNIMNTSKPNKINHKRAVIRVLTEALADIGFARVITKR